MEIENIERREHIRRKTKLRIATGTVAREGSTGAGDRQGCLEGPRRHAGGPTAPRVYFEEFNPDSLSIVIFYWYEPPDYWAFLRPQ